MSFLTPLAFLGALLAAPIILMYMLRLRRREVLVSSTFLWQQVLQDNEANTPWQRLRRNLLLLLQLLILALLVFALARPFMTVPAVSTGQIALLLDASASMNATDDSGTRFAAAQQQALEIVETMSNEDSMTVIRVAGVPEVLAPRTQDRAELREAILGAAPSQTQADWSAALTLAAGTATASANDFSVVIIGDGGLGANNGLPGVQGEITYVPIGGGGGNVAITALATRTLGGNAPQLFAQVRNYGVQPAEVVFDLEVDGEIFTAERYTIPAGENVSVVSDTLPTSFEQIEAGIVPASGANVENALPTDDTAFAVSDNVQGVEALLVSEGNVFLDRVLSSLPSVTHINATPGQAIPSRPFDLYIFDNTLPATLPQGDVLLVNPPPDTGLFTLAAASEDTANPTVADFGDLSAFLSFDNVNIRTFNPVSASWLEPLVTLDGGTAIGAGELDGRQVAIIAFPLGESDLPLQIAFPILMNNLMAWFQPESAIIRENALRTSESLTLTPPTRADRVRVTKPSGERREFEVTGGPLIYADTDELGIYTIEVFEGSETLQTEPFAVNLFYPLESDIAPRPEITLGDATVAPDVAEEELGQREFWRWLALAALLILMLEWFVYQRRLAGPRGVFRPVLNRRRT